MSPLFIESQDTALLERTSRDCREEAGLCRSPYWPYPHFRSSWEMPSPSVVDCKRWSSSHSFQARYSGSSTEFDDIDDGGVSIALGRCVLRVAANKVKRLSAQNDRSLRQG